MKSPSPSLDPRARQLLRTLISRYIRDGEPVGSQTLARHAGQLRGLRWTGQRPEFVRREGDAWVVEPVRLGQWPKTLRPDWSASATPQLLFTPEGWAQPGTLLWRWPQGSQRWQWGRDGRLLTQAAP